MLIKSRKRKRAIIQFNKGRKRTIKVATDESKCTSKQDENTGSNNSNAAEACFSNYQSTADGKKVRGN